MALLFEDQISYNRPAFVSKLTDIAQSLNMNPNWLMAVINSETGGTFSPSIVNPNGGATGLIQFMPKTAIGLGTTTAALAKMSNLEQLDYVYRYFYPYRNHITKFEDLYLITFYPNADGKHAGTLSKPDDWAFPQDIYPQNKGVDMNKDGKITIADFREFAFRKIPAFMRGEFAKTMGVVTDTVKYTRRNWLPITAVTAGLAIVVAALIYLKPVIIKMVNKNV